MSTVALADICLELPSLEPKYIKDVLVPHLILEFDMGGSVIASTRLSWYNANRTHPQPTTGIWASWWQLLFGTSEVIHRPLGDENRVLVEGTTVKERKIWSTNKKLAMNDLVGELEISAWIELGAEEYELIGSAKLNGSTLYESVGKELEAPLIHPGTHLTSILKTRVIYPENSSELTSGARRQRIPSCRESLVNKIRSDSIAASKDFQRYGNTAGLEQAILQLETTIQALPEGDPKLPALLDNLGSCLLRRFRRLGRLTDVNDAVARHQVAVDLTPGSHPHRPNYLSNLGTSLQARFQRLGSVNDLDDAILRQQAAINLISNDHPDKPGHLNNLGNSLQTRFERLGNVNDLDAAISQKQEAVNLTASDHPDKPGRLNNLGLSLETRFGRLGNIRDLDEAISHQRESVRLTPGDHPDKSGRLNNLGNSLQIRFYRLGNIGDLHNAVSHQQEAVNLTPDRHPDKPGRLNNLGNSLRTRFQWLEKINDLDDAISRQQEAVNLTPEDDPHKPKYLNNLGISLQTRFQRLKNVRDLDDSITIKQESINLTPEGHPDKPSRLDNLGISLRTRFERLGSISDLDTAAVRHQEAIDLTPDGHYQRPTPLLNLSNTLLTRFNHYHQFRDAEAAISYSSAAAQSSIGDPYLRFNAADAWIRLASRIHHPSLLSAYECAIGLIPFVAWLGLSIQDRHQILTRIGGMTRDAAAAAISARQYEKALEWLEQGRSIVWTQILHLRTPVDELRDLHPDLANRFLQVSQLLDQGHVPSGSSKGDERSIEEEGRKYRALTTEWESIIEQVRKLPNLDNFLRPMSSSRLMSAAHRGPVVVLNVAKERCDALTILPGSDKLIHIPLPSITFDRVIELRDELKDLLCSNGFRMRGERAAKKLIETDDDDCKHILAELWTKIVKPVIDILKFSPHPETLPRIWWCATGPLAFLPMHAAGIYDSNSMNMQLSDYAISSYTPTLEALLESPNSITDSSFRLLSVIQPSAPGVSSIPYTKEELDNIRRRLPKHAHIILEGREGTKARVTKAMHDCNWLHLACHGVQKPIEPTKSALILEDGHLTLDEIIRLNLPKAELAFLSACQTTTGDEKLSEEAVHIAGAMLLAGYRGVVATMWSIRDELAPEVTDGFYGHIMRDGGRPDSGNAAEALHLSVQKLRKKAGVSITDWIPFVHLGI